VVGWAKWIALPATVEREALITQCMSMDVIEKYSEWISKKVPNGCHTVIFVTVRLSTNNT